MARAKPMRKKPRQSEVSYRLSTAEMSRSRGSSSSGLQLSRKVRREVPKPNEGTINVLGGLDESGPQWELKAKFTTFRLEPGILAAHVVVPAATRFL